MTNRLIQPPPKPALIAASPAAPATDGELLLRFSRHGDQEAFAEVVERHHAMVWGVCSRVLVRRADAEDAYQATLLILARKARAIRANDSAGGWLFRVAHNAALQTLRRRKALRETPLDEAALPPEAPFPDLEQKQLVVALLEELRAMPAKYQTPLVLRYLEGRSRREIAAATESTVATVAGQLVRGRRMLRSRLARRGVSLGLVISAMGVGSTSHAAGTIHATPPVFDPALLTASASGAVTTLVNQGVRSMFYASVTKPVAVGLAASLVAAVLLVGSQEGAAQSEAEPALQLGVSIEAIEADGSEPAAVRFSENDGVVTGKVQTAKTPVAKPGQEPPEVYDVFVLEGLKKHYAKLAEDETAIDLSQPGFEELYWHRSHWETREAALKQQLMTLDRNRQKLSQLVAQGSVAKGEYDRVRQELDTLRSELPLAKAKIAEYERLMKQAALRETQPQKGDTPKLRSTGENRIDRNESWQAPPQFQPPPTSLREAKLESDTIEPGEMLKIEIIDTLRGTGLFKGQAGFGNPVVSAQIFVVDREGQVPLGALLGRVQVAGKTAPDAEEAIRSAVERRLHSIQARKAQQAERSGDETPEDREFDIAVQVTRATPSDPFSEVRPSNRQPR